MPEHSAKDSPLFGPLLHLFRFNAAFAVVIALLAGVGCGPGTVEDNDPKDKDEVELPSAPTLSGATGDASATLTWGDVEGAESYVLYFGVGELDLESATRLEDVTSPYTVSDLENDTKYGFAVAAKNSTGEGGWSNVVVITPTADLQPPTAPTNVAAEAGGGLVTVSWDDVEWADAYDLYWSDVIPFDEETATLVESVTSPYEVTGLANGVEYSFAVVARNTAGSSPFSHAVTALLALDAPANVKAVSGIGGVTVTWSAVEGADSYVLYFGAGELNAESATRVEDVTSPHRVSDLQNGTEYSFAVAALNSAGEGTWSNVVTATPTAALQPPAAPTNIVAEGGDGLVTVTWEDVERADSYDLYWSNEVPFNEETATLITSVTSPYEVTGLANGAEYAFAIVARNDAGSSPLSSIATALLAPDAPTNVKADAGTGLVTVSWDDVVGAEAYDLYWSDTVPFDANTAALIESVTSPHDVAELEKGVEYQFVVASRNATGQGPLSKVATAFIPLDAPINVQASNGEFDDKVVVTWEPVEEADKYLVLRDDSVLGETTSTSWEDTTAEPGAVGAVELVASDGDYTDRVTLSWTVTPDSRTVHSYRVIAVRGNVESAPSDTDTGYRQSVSGFEVSLDDGNDFIDVDLVTTWDDLEAPTGTIFPGVPSASQGDFDSHVELSLVGSSTEQGSQRTYLVQATSHSGSKVTSNMAQGRRGIGKLQYQWQRADLDADPDDFIDIPGATYAIDQDPADPANRVGQLYRCKLSAEGAENAISSTTEGFALESIADIPRNLGVVNGYAHTMLAHEGTVYVAGDFDHVGPVTRGLVLLNSSTAAVMPSGPQVDTDVFAVTPDGLGGIYIAGFFNSVDGEPRSKVARILGNGQLDSNFNPGYIDGVVHALALADDQLFIGGSFTTVADTISPNLAALDPTSGALLEWSPAPAIDGNVLELAVGGGRLFVAGALGSTESDDKKFAVYDANTGLELLQQSFPTGSEYEVRALAVHENTVYVAGSFDTFLGQSRTSLASLSIDTLDVTSWSPVTNYVDKPAPLYDLYISEGTLFAGGVMWTVDGQYRPSIAAFDATSGNLTDWSSNGVNGTVLSMVRIHDTLYVGGAFFDSGGTERTHLAAFDANTGALSDWTTTPDGYVHALVDFGGNPVAAGNFSSVGMERRDKIAAFDLSTGTWKDWNPGVTGPVTSLAAHGNTIYVGGSFDSMAGLPRQNLAAFNASTGELTDPEFLSADNFVQALTVSGDTLYVGGAFENLAGQPRQHLASFDLANDTLTDWNPGVDGLVLSIVTINDTIYAGGAFSQAGGQERTFLAAFDANTGAVTDWNPTVDKEVRALEVRRDMLFAGGDFITVNGQDRHYLAAFELSSGDLASWSPSANGSIISLGTRGNSVYAGGGFTTISGEWQPLLAAVDALTGNLTVWRPPYLANTYFVTKVEANHDAVYAAQYYGAGSSLIIAYEP